MKASAKKTAECNRLLMEFCCVRDSKLGQMSKASAGCKTIRYTEEEDMTSDNGLQKALADLKGWKGRGNVALWSSIPCTGGSSWQYVNEVIYGRTGNDRAMKRVRGLQSVFSQLWGTPRESG